MPTYVLACAADHVFEVRQSWSAPLPPCACGAATRKLPVPFATTGRGAASLPPPPERMPQTWRGTYEGNREYLTHLRRVAERRTAIEERHPELAGDRRPILAHEGRYEGAPLRAGDPLPGPATPSPAHGHTHGAGGHSHGAGGHSHPS